MTAGPPEHRGRRHHRRRRHGRGESCGRALRGTGVRVLLAGVGPLRLRAPSRASMRAPPRSATPASASSAHWASGSRWQRRPSRSARSMSPRPGASGSRAWRPPSRASRPSATCWPTVPWGRRCGARCRASRSSPCAFPRAWPPSTSAPMRCTCRSSATAARPSRSRTRLIVAADGAHSQVRAAAGIAGEHRGLRAGGRGCDRRQPTARTPAAPTSASPPPGRSPCCRCTTAASRSSGPARPGVRRQLLALSDAAYLAGAAGHLWLARGSLRARRAARLLSTEADACRRAPSRSARC